MYIVRPMWAGGVLNPNCPREGPEGPEGPKGGGTNQGAKLL